jgi:dihydrofolate reductase
VTPDRDDPVRPAGPQIALIAAVADNGVIGQGNALPWRLPADLAHFKQLTLDKPILMGRRTWESLPGLLPRRRHLVLTRDPDYQASGCVVVGSIETALAAAGDAPELMVVGGADLYAQTLPMAARLYLTRVHAEPEGDTRFPDWDVRDWLEIERREHPADPANPIAMTFLTLVRRGVPHAIHP